MFWSECLVFFSLSLSPVYLYVWLFVCLHAGTWDPNDIPLMTVHRICFFLYRSIFRAKITICLEVKLTYIGMYNLLHHFYCDFYSFVSFSFLFSFTTCFATFACSFSSSSCVFYYCESDISASHFFSFDVLL